MQVNGCMASNLTIMELKMKKLELKELTAEECMAVSGGLKTQVISINQDYNNLINPGYNPHISPDIRDQFVHASGTQFVYQP